MASNINEKVAETVAEKVSTGIKVAEKVGIKTSHYIITGLALTVGMAWNDAIKVFIDKTYNLDNGKNNISAKFIYAVIITIFLVVVIELLPDTKEELPNSTKKLIEYENFNKKRRMNQYL